MKLGTDTILVQDDEASVVMLDERAIVVGIRAGSYFDFNKIGSEIWRMLAKPCSVGQIFETLFQAHDVEMDVMKRDVTAFLHMLINNRLVRVIGPGITHEG